MVISHSQNVAALTMSSLIFKNSVISEGGLVWFSVDEKVRPQIKEGLLSLLADNDKSKVKASSYTLFRYKTKLQNNFLRVQSFLRRKVYNFKSFEIFV